MPIYNGAYSGTDIDRILTKADSSNVASVKISKEDFDELEEKDPKVVYYVYDEKNKIRQYMGDAELAVTKITSGSIINHMKNHITMLTGNIVEEV